MFDSSRTGQLYQPSKRHHGLYTRVHTTTRSLNIGPAAARRPPPIALGERAPNGELALDVDHATRDPTRLDDRQLIESITALEKLTAWAGARQTRLLAEFARHRPADHPTDTGSGGGGGGGGDFSGSDTASGSGSSASSDSDPATGDPSRGSDTASQISRYAADEIAVALHLARGTATARLADAIRLARDLPATLDAWETGHLDRLKVRAITEATLPLTVQTARRVEARVLARAATQTPAQLRARLKRAVIAADPDGANDRHRAANRQRRVVLTPEAEGMASLWALLSAPDATAAYASLSRLAAGLGTEDPRPIDARRADLLADLLTGRLALTHTTTAARVTTGLGTAGGGAAGTGTDACASSASHTGSENYTRTGDTPGPADCTSSGDRTSAAVCTSSGGAAGSSDSPSAASVSSASAATGSTQGCTICRDCTRPDVCTAQQCTDASALSAAPQDNATADRSATNRPPVRTTPPPPGKPLIQVVVGIDTLTGANNHPAELVGYGPIPAELARRLAADAVWKRLRTDPDSGALLDHGRNTYHPPAALADHIRARDVYCRFPGCRRRALDADLDHTVAWEHGGPTDADNLNALCVHHHRLKHQGGWQVHAHPDGTLTWVTPTGHRHTTEPHDYRPDPGLPTDNRATDSDPPSPAEEPPPF